MRAGSAAESVGFKIRISSLRRVLTMRGRMKLTDLEVDDLIHRADPRLTDEKFIDYRDIIDVFFRDIALTNTSENNRNKDTDTENETDDSYSESEVDSPE